MAEIEKSKGEVSPPEPKSPEADITLGEIASSTDPNLVRDQISDGKLVPTSLAEAYRNSLDKAYPNVKLTPAGAHRVRQFVSNMRMGGSAGVLLVCSGDDCEFKAACPLHAEKVAPVGESCPLEAMVVMDTRQELASLVDLDTKNPVIRGYINELTQVAILVWRCQMKLAYDFHDVMQQVPACVTPEGIVHTKPEASPILETLDRLSARRSRLLKELTQTPESLWRREAAVGNKVEDSLSRGMAARKAQLQKATGILPNVVAPPAHVQLPGATPIPSEKSDSEKS
jgi:hypothetical protein